MGDRDEELSRGQSGRGWVSPDGAVRTESLFWTSPQITSFVPRRREGADLYRVDPEGRQGDSPK
jgi:hypothetical protein